MVQEGNTTVSKEPSLTGNSSVPPSLSSKLLRLLGLNAASSFFVAALHYLVLYGTIPILFIVIDAILYLLISAPVSALSVFILSIPRSGAIFRLVLASNFAIVSAALAGFSLSDSRNSGLSQKISGIWAFIDGYPTPFGMAVIGANSLVLSLLTVFSLWFVIVKNKN
jgi:hypothetical protein